MVFSSTPQSRIVFSSASFHIRHLRSSLPWLYAILNFLQSEFLVLKIQIGRRRTTADSISNFDFGVKNVRIDTHIYTDNVIGIFSSNIERYNLSFNGILIPRMGKAFFNSLSSLMCGALYVAAASDEQRGGCA